MLDHRLRVYKDVVLQPLATHMENIPPNLITLLAALVGLAAAGAATIPAYGLALGLWLANRVLDGLDGMVARQCQRQSDFGGYLDIVLDFVVYAALPIALYFGAPSNSNGVGVILLLSSFYVNSASWLYLSAILEKRQVGADERGELTTITMPPGLIGGTETILFYVAFLIWPDQLFWLFVAMGALVMVSVAQRLWWAYHNLPEDQPRAKEARPGSSNKTKADVSSTGPSSLMGSNALLTIEAEQTPRMAPHE